MMNISNSLQFHVIGLMNEQVEIVEYRLCLKHVYWNWRKKYLGIEMKEGLWKASLQYPKLIVYEAFIRELEKKVSWP